MAEPCDDRVDHEASKVFTMMKEGDHITAAQRLQEDARIFRPGEYAELLGEIKGMSKMQDTLSHLEITPILTRDGDPQGRLNVSLVTPAIDNCGRQYVDRNGRPMAYVEQIASIDNHDRGQVVEVCPRIEMPPPPCEIERPWLRCDDNRPKIRIGLDLPGIDLNVRIGGGPAYERVPVFERPPIIFQPPFPDRHHFPWESRGRWNSRDNDNHRGDNDNHRGGSNGNGNGDRVVNNGSNNDTIINNTTIINKTETKTVNNNKTTVNHNETVVVTRPGQGQAQGDQRRHPNQNQQQGDKDQHQRHKK